MGVPLGQPLGLSNGGVVQVGVASTKVTRAVTIWNLKLFRGGRRRRIRFGRVGVQPGAMHVTRDPRPSSCRQITRAVKLITEDTGTAREGVLTILAGDPLNVIDQSLA